MLLRTDIYRPDDIQKHPAILFRTPYNKVFSVNGDMLNVVEAAHAGYAIVIQDVRGRFASDGEYRRDRMAEVEGSDGYDSVEWIARQPWCDGNVGMAGTSYLAAVQWLTAMESPPHLKAIAPWMGTADSSMEPPFTGGAILLPVAISWIPMIVSEVADRLEREGRDVSEIRTTINWVQSHPEEAYNYLPLKDMPIIRSEPFRQIWNARVNPTSSETARRQRWEQVKVPCLHLCGWFDIFEYGTFDSYKIMHKRGGSQLAREGQHIIAGPWPHGRLPDFLGGLNFGSSAGSWRAQVSEQNIAYFDRYLRGKDINIPAVRYFVMGKNRWQNADNWPLPQTQWQKFYLHSRGHANTAAGDGSLSLEEPGLEPADIFAYNPLYPVPTIGGRLIGPVIVAGPLEQSQIEKRHDVLCYTMSELKEDMEVTGPIEIHIFAATSARSTDFTAKLVDVYPDGQAFNIVDGIKRSPSTKSSSWSAPINPGEINEYTVFMGNTSQLFRKGHRVRIDISSSNFPLFDRNMNTGNPIGEDVNGIPATQEIHHESRYASYVLLPVISPKSIG